MLWYCLFRLKRQRMYALANKIKSPDEHHPVFGIALNVLGSTEDIMNKMKTYSEFTTESNGIAKAWLGPLLYCMITDPNMLEVLLKKHLEKDELHRFIRALVGNASIFAPVSVWRPRRKIAVPAFSPRILASFVDVFAARADELSKLLTPKAGTGNFKIWSYVNAYSLDAIMETAMGTQIKAQQNQDNVILKAVNESLRLSCERIFHLWLQPAWLYWFFPQHAKLMYYTKIVHDFTDKIIAEKKMQLSSPNTEFQTDEKPDVVKSCIETTFLDLLITQSGGYNDLELREEVLTFIVAAMDTSAVTISFTLKVLGKYPKVQEKVFEELEAVFGDSDRLLHRNDLPKLQYLERVIKETLRLFPSVPFIIRTAEEDTYIDEDITIPKGSGIIVSIWGVHRNPKIWGPDALSFDPDRFLPERCKNLHPCSYIPFSYGPRNCLGYQYAMMSMKTALSSILRRYRVVGEPEKGPVPHIPVKLEVMLKAVDGYEVALELR
ncbi:unnamed protein product [Leptosia nina]|uniref:Cytochrome P450 n=1 Tax=Leptosia nina TaxID=320188 RepID=A0AAV1JW20_9NEOP